MISEEGSYDNKNEANRLCAMYACTVQMKVPASASVAAIVGRFTRASVPALALVRKGTFRMAGA
jgi:hypothetical protein